MTIVKGHLEILDRGFGFLRSIDANFNHDTADTFVPAHLINQLRLSEGLYIEGTGVKGDGDNRNLKLNAVDTVNGMSLKQYSSLTPLKELTSINPSERLLQAQGADDLMGKTLDLITPMGKGQRGLIISPPKSGKTTILQHMAQSVSVNHPNVKVFVLLIDERPEEVTDFKRSLKKTNVLFSSADQGVSQHMRMTRITMNTAIRCVESGDDVVVFIDSLTRMARTFNRESQSHGRTLTGGLGANAMDIPRQIFGAARNVENGGSLTIMATILVDTGSKMDDIIFQEFKGTGNMDLALSRACAEKRIWPAVNINKSGTRKEELLLSKTEMNQIMTWRRKVSALDETAAMTTFLELLKNP